MDVTSAPYNKGNNEPSPTVYHQERPASNIPNQQARSVLTMPPFSNQPTPCVCPYCHQTIITRVEKSNGLIVWLAAGGICLFGCVLGCCLIPFFIDDIKNSTHYCPSCNQVIGRHKKL